MPAIREGRRVPPPTRGRVSLTRGEAGPGSDIDLLYELAQRRLFGWDIEDLSQDLADLFGRPVDLVSRTALHPLIREQVLADVKPFYHAA